MPGRPFKIKFVEIGEVRHGSPYNHCNIELIGTNIKLEEGWWQDLYAWSQDSKRLVFVKWNFDNNDPSFHLFLLNTENGKNLLSPKILGLPDELSVQGEIVKFKKFLYDKAKSQAGRLCCYHEEEYQFIWD